MATINNLGPFDNKSRGPFHQNSHNNLIGFDELFKMLEVKPQHRKEYPPHNLIKTSDNDYILSIPIIGRSKEDINIEIVNGKLIVSAPAIDIPENHKMLESGIAFRSIKKEFVLHEYLTVTNATVKNGLLDINMVYELPENKKSKTIPIF